MLRFKLYSLSGLRFDEDVSEVLLPTKMGTIGVLSNHMPLVSVAANGLIGVRRKASDRDDDMVYFAASGGVIEVDGNTLSVLVDEADAADDINLAEVEKAFELAQKMKHDAHDQLSLDKAQSLIDRQSVRLKVAGLRRNRRR